MTRRILDLSTLPWQFGRAGRQSFGPQPVDDRASVVEWLPAAVPGDVRADLIAAGRIPPVETPEGIAAGAWVDDCDWWYRVELPGGLAPDDVAVLEADGIDYYSAVWLDDRRLATHAGMFSRQAIVLSPWLNAPGAHELAIRVWGGGALPRLPNPPWRRAMRWLVSKLSPGTEYFPDRMATPKAQFSFGWDFSPRLLSAGIWDEIRLVIARGAYIEDLWVQAEPLVEEGEQGKRGEGSRGDGERGRLHRRGFACVCRSGGGRRAQYGLRSPSPPRDSLHPQSKRPSISTLTLTLTSALTSASTFPPPNSGGRGIKASRASTG